MPLPRRTLLAAFPLLATAAARAAAPRAATPPRVEIWKDPQCGCCNDWVRHLQKNGFATLVHEGGHAEARTRLGIPAELGSCHTGQVAGYAVEGHVPASAIQRLLADKPKNAVGLTVPGMPIGSPGMDGPAYGGRRDAYDVLLVLEGGRTQVFERHPAG